MRRVPLGNGAYLRAFANGAEIRMENRFFEAAPNAEESALLSRPGSIALFGVTGGAPYSSLFAKDGVFDGDLFYSSAAGLHRYAFGSSPQAISSSTGLGDDLSFAIASGLNYEHLFIASDGVLKVYKGSEFAAAYIQIAATPISDQTVRAGGVYYKWKGAGTVDDGAPDGTIGSPYLVNHSGGATTSTADNLVAFESLIKAINASGEPGVDYSSALTERNPSLRAEGTFVEVVFAGLGIGTNIYARERGTSGNLFAVEAVAGDITVGNAVTSTTSGAVFLDGGGVHQLSDVTLPEGLEVDRVVSLSGFVLAVERNSQRFFYIRPGELEIEALDFESAESEPDRIVDVVKVGDVVWLLGRSSIEAWYASGEAERPVQRMAGMAFRIGAVRNSVAVLQNTAVFVGTDNVVYALSNAPQRISNHGIEERLRSATNLEIKAWSFSLDGHFFYVLSIETIGTYVYDIGTQQWHHWYVTDRAPFWNLVKGVVWSSRVVAADWDGDAVWQMDAASMLDEDTDPITRVVLGLLPHRERHFLTNSLFRIYGGWAANDDPNPSTVSLRFSDDAGETWHGPYVLTLEELKSQELSWQSLGMVGQPGRIWEVTDTGGLVRIDGAYAQLD